MQRRYSEDIESRVIELRNQKMGYQTIANALSMRKESVRYYCTKNGINGVLGLIVEKKPEKTKKKYHCVICGEELTGSKKKYCSDKCGRFDENVAKKNIRILKRHKVCKQCGKEFVADNNNAVYCSTICREKHHNENPCHTKRCESCGKEFKTNISIQRMCSVECGRKMQDHVNGFGEKEQRERSFSNTLNETYKGKYEYVSGYYHSDGTFKMKCCVCGHIQERSAVMARHKKDIKCDVCNGIKRRKEHDHIESLKERNKLIKVIERQIRKIRTSMINEERTSNRVEYKLICQQCGEEFTSTNKSKKYCAKSCMNKRNSKAKDVNRRKHIRDNGNIDYSISVIRLVKKHKGTCSLCGEKINYKDFKITEQGHFIAGNNYPSIDHIIPVSKGGTHTWNNVQLAHCLCNSYKSNNGDVKIYKGRLMFDI